MLHAVFGPISNISFMFNFLFLILSNWGTFDLRSKEVSKCASSKNQSINYGKDNHFSSTNNCLSITLVPKTVFEVCTYCSAYPYCKRFQCDRQRTFFCDIHVYSPCYFIEKKKLEKSFLFIQFEWWAFSRHIHWDILLASNFELYLFWWTQNNLIKNERNCKRTGCPWKRPEIFLFNIFHTYRVYDDVDCPSQFRLCKFSK